MRPVSLLLTLALALAASAPAAAQRAAYFGSLHDHTADGGDDGRGSVADALAAAKANGFHFFGISPHNHMISREHFARFRQQVAAADEPGTFVPFAGFEWGAISKGGHVGVVGSHELITAEATDWDGFWSSAEKDAGDPLLILNHPVWGRSYGGRASPERVPRARLMEVLGGPGEYEGEDFAGRCEFSHREWALSLNAGWRCGVAYGEDNHTAKWGRVNRTRMGVWADRLERAALWEGLRARRTFVTEDPRMTVWIQSGATPMGGDAAAGPAPLAVTVTHAGEAVTDVAVYLDPDGPGGRVADEVERQHTGAFETKLAPAAPGAYAFVVARDASGDLAWSSPIWFGHGVAPAADGRPEVVDLNFASAADLDHVQGFGRGTVKKLMEARRAGTIFRTVADLASVLPRELVDRVAKQVRVSTPEETFAALLDGLGGEDSLVVTGARATAAHYQKERAERLLAMQVAELIKAGERARAKAVLGLLGEGRAGLAQSHKAVWQMLRKAALDEGFGPALAELTQ